MNTTAAATHARVTAATIRTWCRRGVVTAVKQAGRWIIDTASLARRIAIGNRRTRKASMTEQLPIHLTARTRTVPGHIGAVGPADTLRTAYETGQPVTLHGKFAGERVYLGHTRLIHDDGITAETIGYDQAATSNSHPDVEYAVYLIDMKRLDEAPRLKALVAAQLERETAAAMAAEIRAREEDDRIDAADREEY